MKFEKFCREYSLDPGKAESALIYEYWLDSLPVYTDRELKEVGKPKMIGEPYVIEIDDAGFQFLSLLFAILGALIYAVCF